MKFWQNKMIFKKKFLLVAVEKIQTNQIIACTVIGWSAAGEGFAQGTIPARTTAGKRILPPDWILQRI